MPATTPGKRHQLAAAGVHHIEGNFQLFDTARGGRAEPVESPFRPLHRVHENYLAIARHEYPGVEQVAPGASARVHAWFVKPEIYPHSLWEGREIEVLEGEQVIGKLTVTKVTNAVLAGSAASHAPLWIAPPARPEPGYFGIGFMCLVYAVFAGLALWWAIDAYTPCVTNFEGGCSMAKGMLATGSCIFAAIAAVTALGVRGVLLAKSKTQPYAHRAGIVLCGVPLAYTLYTLQALFFG